MLSPDNAVLLIVDVQGKLAELMHDRDALFDNLRRLIQGARALGLPIVVTEQNPDGLGPTRAEIADLLADVVKIPKHSFSCCGEPQFVAALAALGRTQVLLAGIETHICVYQTAVELVEAGCEVEIVADAVSSRTAANRAIGLEKARDAGATVTCVETALFEMLRTAEAPAFKAILNAVK
ncbi:hydrolase [bacterium]|nr:hydrolase [bacterium]